MRLLASIPLAGAMLGLLAAPAAAVQRYAAPAGATTGACAVASPCRIDYAVNSAPLDADVVVTAGTYTVNVALAPPNRITLRGTGATRPRLLGAASAPTLTFNNGGTVQHLEITGTGQDALKLQGATAEDLWLSTDTGNAAWITGSPTATVLRDSVAVVTGAGTGVRFRDPTGPAGNPDMAVVNVTASAPGGIAVRCEAANGTTRLVNVIASGSTDINAQNLGGACTTSHSSFRFSATPGLTVRSADIDGAAQFANAAAGDFHLPDGSPLIDAGIADVRLGGADADGLLRTAGSAPDVGAFEHPVAAPVAAPVPSPVAAPIATPAPAAAVTPPTSAPGDTPTLIPGDRATAPDGDRDGTPDAQDPTPTAPAAVLGRTVIVAPATGTVAVRPPGARTFTELDGSTFVPAGSLVDTRHGTVSLSSVVGTGGQLQTGTFHGGLFEVRQASSGRGMTDLVLRGGDFAHCPKPRAGRTTAAASAKKKKRKPTRRLWTEDDGGKFRTHGRNSVATARGTAWLTEDTCAGTRTKVSKDSVSVQPTRGGKATIVRAGHELLVRPVRPR
jgi:hypothetical protein